MAKILLTGANGFIGKNLIEELVLEGHQIVALVRPTTDTSVFSKKNIPFIIDTKSITKLKSEIIEQKIDGVVHLASLYIKTHSSEDIDNLCESNISFGARLLESITNTSVKWFLNTGTFWQHYNDNQYSPVNLYAASKQAFNSLMQFYCETGKINYLTLKLNDTFGPNDPRPKIFNLLLKIARSGESLNMSGGEQIMDISFIKDVSSAYITLIKLLNENSSLIESGNSYGIHSMKRLTLKELVSEFENTYGKKVNINWGALPYRDREVMLPWSNFKRIPNWEPTFSLKSGIELTLKEMES